MPVSTTHKKGASIQYHSMRQGFIAYCQSHKTMSMSALSRLIHPLSNSILIWLAIAVFLTLPCGLYLLIDNAQKFSGPLQSMGRITAFVRQNITDAELLHFNQTVRQQPAVISTHYLSPEHALKEFKDNTDMSGALTYLTDNPLPGVLLIDLQWHTPQTQLNELLTQLNALPEVIFVQSDITWIKRLYALLEVGQRFTWTVASLLGIAILLMINNILRLSIAARHDEIRIIHLVGGSHAYIRRPFLYEGFWHGLIGGLLACALLMLCLLLIMPSINHLIALYDKSVHLHSLTINMALCLIITSAGLGWLSAFWAVNRHLVRL